MDLASNIGCIHDVFTQSNTQVLYLKYIDIGKACQNSLSHSTDYSATIPYRQLHVKPSNSILLNISRDKKRMHNPSHFNVFDVAKMRF